MRSAWSCLMISQFRSPAALGQGAAFCPMQSLEGRAVIHPKNHPHSPCALFDFRRSVWLRPKTAAEVVQCCKNCLLVIFTVCSLQSVHGVGFIHSAFSRTPMQKDAAQVGTWMSTWVLKKNALIGGRGDDAALRIRTLRRRGGEFAAFQSKIITI